MSNYYVQNRSELNDCGLCLLKIAGFAGLHLRKSQTLVNTLYSNLTAFKKDLYVTFVTICFISFCIRLFP